MTATLVVSPGDPGGVGPEICLRAAEVLTRPALREDKPLAGVTAQILIVGDAAALAALAAHVAPALATSPRCRPEALAKLSQCPGVVFVDGVCWHGLQRPVAAPSAAHGAAQLAALDLALRLVADDTQRVLVTGPVCKAAVELAGHAFTGHTEYLALRAGLTAEQVTMLFLGPRLRVALATTHVSLAQLPALVTTQVVQRSVRHLLQALRALDATAKAPTTLAVTGLNPHAGEHGLFGREEIDTIAPALATLRRQPALDGVCLQGPMGAETAFRLAFDRQVDGVVAMIHDQATIACKLVDWGHSVNVTWGLPYVRTSVDHGVGFAAACAGKVDATGMCSAMQLGIKLAPVAPA